MTPPDAALAGPSAAGPALLDRHGAKADAFCRLPAAEIAGHPAVLVAFADLATARLAAGPATRLGVEIANGVPAAALLAHLDALALIAIGFPSFSDGRGFSIARSLRKAGFTGLLRAVGPLIADQFVYALACGFDEIELPPAVAQRQPVAQWQAALGAHPGAYQRGYAGAGSILDRRKGRQARTDHLERSSHG